MEVVSSTPSNAAPPARAASAEDAAMPPPESVPPSKVASAAERAPPASSPVISEPPALDIDIPWRLQDPADVLQEERQKLSSGKLGMNVSFQFVRYQKSNVVLKTFDMAAECVLDAVPPPADPVVVPVDPFSLPQALQDRKDLQTQRCQSIERSVHNKELAKKKTKPTKTPVVAEPKPEVDAPKFTRNTPASSAAALDARFQSSRAILCAAGNISFSALTPGEELDLRQVPQAEKVNMGAVVVEARTLGQRAIRVVETATQRAKLRYEYRRANVEESSDHEYFHLVSDDDGEEELSRPGTVSHQPSLSSRTDVWKDKVLPRLRSVLSTGSGHAIYHDVQWATRYGRVAHLIESLAADEQNFGPHLIVTTEVEDFAKEFHHTPTQLFLPPASPSALRVMVYPGTADQKKKSRRMWKLANGLPTAPFHVLVTSYADLLQDFGHFCQLPWETVILDDGVSWMAMALSDPNSALGSIWSNGLFSSNDNHVGLAGTSFNDWDFTQDDWNSKDAWVGLTARHRIAVSRSLHLQSRMALENMPVAGVVDFCAPAFADVVREEWDRSRIVADAASMSHFRRIVARMVVVHDSSNEDKDLLALGIDALSGKLPTEPVSNSKTVPEIISDDSFVTQGKVAYSRRSSLSWFGPIDKSWLRYELGKANLQSILDFMRGSVNHGHYCEEITTASSTTSSGASGQVAGTLAYRCAVRCGRHFGSEQGLRLHISALHAIPGTWLCRTCGVDCITSQARTHHERSCGQPSPSAPDSDGVSAPSTTPGQASSSKAGVGKKKNTSRSSSAPQAAPGSSDEKDADGSFRVPGYRGVWVTKDGKHFVKQSDGTRFEVDGTTSFFDSIDDAAKKYDSIVSEGSDEISKLELNFKEDGTRITYEDSTPSTQSGLGGSASNVVPALAVINIKDLPPDVKPLLRDPRQTSRTGGNSKRHVYAYRGVCRQARKGHDRWQSQISFMGVNHYLGTFDSEWDAAAIYAWAHLILYGEEATRQAQLEGEQAAAAYEQEKRDLAEGRIVEAPKSEKKKRAPKKEKGDVKGKVVGNAEAEVVVDSPPAKPEAKKRKSTPREGSDKKMKITSRSLAEGMSMILAKSVTKAPVLGSRDLFDTLDTNQLSTIAAKKLLTARQTGYVVSDAQKATAPCEEWLRPSFSVRNSESVFAGGAMLLGLTPSLFGWDMQEFLENHNIESNIAAVQMISVEYDPGHGVNERFRSIIQGTVCTIGNAAPSTQYLYSSMGFGSAPLGGTIGRLDAHIGATPGSCSEMAAVIRFNPREEYEFTIECLNADDMVTKNGERILPRHGEVPLYNEDICSVGPRVFVFLCAT